MRIKVDRFEVIDISALLKGDVFTYLGMMYVVTDKTFEHTKAFNMERHCEVFWDNAIPQDVTRVKGGYITA